MSALDPFAAEDWEIEPEDLARARHAGSCRLIDCREEDEFALCRIEGAELLPLSAFAELAPARLADAALPVVVYCHHGMRSMQATIFLRARGLAKVFSLRGGIDAWSREVDASVPRY